MKILKSLLVLIFVLGMFTAAYSCGEMGKDKKKDKSSKKESLKIVFPIN